MVTDPITNRARRCLTRLCLDSWPNQYVILSLHKAEEKLLKPSALQFWLIIFCFYSEFSWLQLRLWPTDRCKFRTLHDHCSWTNSDLFGCEAPFHPKLSQQGQPKNCQRPNSGQIMAWGFCSERSRLIYWGTFTPTQENFAYKTQQLFDLRLLEER